MVSHAPHVRRDDAGFVSRPAAPERLIAVADATLDADMDRPMSVVDGGKVVEFPACELFENPPEAVANWREMVAKARDRSGAETDETKVTVLSIEHNGAALAEGREEMATVTVRLRSVEGHEMAVKQELGKPRETAAVARALAAKGTALSGDALSRVGLAGVRKDPASFFTALFGTSLGGGRNNVSSNLSALARAAFGPDVGHPVETVSPREFTGTPYARVALLSKYAPDGRRHKTILRTEQPAELTGRMDAAAGQLCSDVQTRFTDVLATGSPDDASGPYGLAARERLKVHALVTKPSMRALEGVSTAVFNSESGELGKFLEDIRRGDPDGEQGDRAQRLLEALRALEEESAGVRAELEGLAALVDDKRLPEARKTDFRGQAESAKVLLERAEERRSRVVKDALGLIAQAGGGAAAADVLVTNGPSGAVGLLYAYDFQVIFRADVLEDDAEEEKRLVDEMDRLSGGVVSMRHRDTTGCGDSCMSAWMAARYAPWAQRRERFYAREIGLTKITPGDYKYACALAEAFWRAAFVKTFSGVMFRCMDANFSRVPDAAVRAMVDFVNAKASAFIRKDLSWLIRSGDGIDEMKPNSFGFWCYRTHKVPNERLPHSVDVLARQLGVEADEAKMMELQTAHTRNSRTPLTPSDLEPIRRAALAQDVEPAWRAWAQEAQRTLGGRKNRGA